MELSAGAFPTNVKHLDEVKEESPKGEARKIIEEYANSLRELIKDMRQRFSWRPPRRPLLFRGRAFGGEFDVRA